MRCAKTAESHGMQCPTLLLRRSSRRSTRTTVGPWTSTSWLSLCGQATLPKSRPPSKERGSLGSHGRRRLPRSDTRWMLVWSASWPASVACRRYTLSTRTGRCMEGSERYARLPERFHGSRTHRCIRERRGKRMQTTRVRARRRERERRDRLTRVGARAVGSNGHGARDPVIIAALDAAAARGKVWTAVLQPPLRALRRAGVHAAHQNLQPLVEVPADREGQRADTRAVRWEH